MKKSDRLIARLARDFGLLIPVGAKIRTLRSGRNQKAAGAWSWALFTRDGYEAHVGSQFTVSQCLSAEELSMTRRGIINGVEILVEKAKRRAVRARLKARGRKGE